MGVQALRVYLAQGSESQASYSSTDNIVYVISLTVSMIITIWLFFELTIPFVCAVVIPLWCSRSKIFEKYALDE